MTPLTGGGQETAKTINLGVCSSVTGCGQGTLFTCHLGLCQAISHYTFCPNGALEIEWVLNMLRGKKEEHQFIFYWVKIFDLFPSWESYT